MTFLVHKAELQGVNPLLAAMLLSAIGLSSIFGQVALGAYVVSRLLLGHGLYALRTVLYKIR